MRAAVSAARTQREALAKKLREYAQVAVAGPNSYVDSLPDSLPWTQSLSQLQATKVSTLDNGLRVASQIIPHTDLSTVGVYLDAGSRYENDTNNGVAHFVEHLMFKGTASRSQMDIELQVEDMGGNLNAYTAREATAYYARCLGKDVPKAVDLIGDMMLNSKIDHMSVSREKDVILREAKEIEGQIEEVVLDHLHATAFQHTPLGRTILGSASNIKAMQREDFLSYIRSHYTAGRMVLVGSGSIDHEELVAAAKATFSSLPPDTTSAADLVAQEPSHFTGSAVAVRDPDMPVTGLAIAFKGAANVDADSVTLSVMQNILGSYSSSAPSGHHLRSKLATAVAQNGLADKVQAFNTTYQDSGLFGLLAQTSKPAELEDLCWIMMNEMTRLAYEVDEDDVQQAKNMLKAMQISQFSSSHGICEVISRDLLTLGRIVPREEYFARIDAVTAETVKECAGRLIQDQDMAIAAVGELSLLPNYNWFRRRAYWNRY